MYSRNRALSGDDRYTNNIPPAYNGNRFSYRSETGVRASDERHPMARHGCERQETDPPTQETALPAPENNDVSEDASADGATAAQAPVSAGEGGILNGLFSGIGREELLLIGLLLLFCAEHDHSMDVIVILLLLLSIK